MRFARAGLPCVLLAFLPWVAVAAEPTGVYLGVASCSGSNCHGATEPWPGSNVRQDEYLTWQASDPHAKAYALLFDAPARRIARNLNLDNAHEAGVCVSCHTHAPPPALRSSRFQTTDGVGCEACHGPGRAWLGDHVAGVADREARDELVKKGMFPTDDPTRRAELCLGCHRGSAQRNVTHRMMGAGHPRLRFELDTFTETGPAHFVVDEDYRKRKQAPSHTRTWAVGQAVAAREFLRGFADGRWSSDGAFPELTFFACHGCHHPMSNLRWRSVDGGGLEPGEPRIDDSNLALLEVIVRRADGDLALELARGRQELQSAARSGAEETAVAAARLLVRVERALQVVEGRAWEIGDTQALLADLAAAVPLGPVDYSTAEQVTMAAAALVSDLERERSLTGATLVTTRRALEACYDAVVDDAAYDPDRFVEAVNSLAVAVESSTPARHRVSGGGPVSAAPRPVPAAARDDPGRPRR